MSSTVEQVVERILREINKHYPINWFDLKYCYNRLGSLDDLIFVLEFAPAYMTGYIDMTNRIAEHREFWRLYNEDKKSEKKRTKKAKTAKR